MKLDGRVALITGGTSGIGRATAELFAREGARVTITGRDETRGAAVAEEIGAAGSEGLFVRSDVRVAADCERSVRETVEAFGRLDILFNNAGVFVANDVVDCAEDEWDAQIDTSLKGAYLMSRFAIPHMRAQGGGAIVNCSSGWGLVGGIKGAAYCAAKGGLVTMTKAMALDHGPEGIRVNAVCPGDTETPMEHEDARHQGLSWDEFVLSAIEGRAIARMGRPEEIALAVLYLASDDSSFVTGVALPVDGGGVAD